MFRGNPGQERENMTDTLEFISNIDLKGNSILNVVIDPATEEPQGSGAAGQLKAYGGTLYVGTGSSWTKLGQASSADEVASRVGALETWKGTAQTAIEKNATDIATNTGDITDLKGRMTTAEGKITTAESKITALEGEMDTAQSDIQALQAAVGDGAEGLATKVAQNTSDIKLKANATDVYTKAETYTKGEVDNAITALNVTQYAKASDVADTFTLYYKKTETYSASEVDNKVATAVASAYKVKGSAATLPASAAVGDVYNISEPFTLDDKTYPAGTNVVYTTDGWDALAGMVDLSGYVLTTTLNSTVDTLNQTIGTKVAKTDYESKMSSIDADLALKAVKTDVDAALALKASIEYVDGEVDTLEGEIAKKANKVTMTAGTYEKVTVNSEGIVTAGAELAAEDLPDITSAKVTDFVAKVKSVRFGQAYTSVGTSQEVKHNLGVMYPQVSVYNTTTGNVIYATVHYNDENTITISGNVELGAIYVVVSP